MIVDNNISLGNGIEIDFSLIFKMCYADIKN